MDSIHQYQQQTEMEHRLWDALDALTTGTWTDDDLALINYTTGLTNYRPTKGPQHGQDL